MRTTSCAIIARIHEACGLDASDARVINGWETSVRANSFWEEFPFRTVRVIRDGSGELLCSVVTDLPSTLTESYLSGDAKGAVAGGMLTLTERVGRADYYFEQPGERAREIHETCGLSGSPAG